MWTASTPTRPTATAASAISTTRLVAHCSPVNVYHLVILKRIKRLFQRQKLTRSALFATNGTSATPFTTPFTTHHHLSLLVLILFRTLLVLLVLVLLLIIIFFFFLCSPTPMAASASSPFANTPHFTSDGSALARRQPRKLCF